MLKIWDIGKFKKIFFNHHAAATRLKRCFFFTLNIYFNKTTICIQIRKCSTEILSGYKNLEFYIKIFKIWDIGIYSEFFLNYHVASTIKYISKENNHFNSTRKFSTKILMVIKIGDFISKF